MDAPKRRCSFCDQTTASYSCPKCGQYYCSVACYNCKQHANCSEAFYKKCVEDELRCSSKEPADEVRKRTLEIIKREYEQLVGQDEKAVDLEELREQFGDLHLADERHLWSKLSEEEKQNFEQLIKRNEIVNLLPVDCWTPWYLKVEPKRLIEQVDGQDDAPENEEENFDLKKDKLIKEIEDKLKQLNCRVPVLDLPIQRLTDLTSISPSPHVKCAIISVLFAYCFVCRHFGNDHLSFPVESFKLIEELSLFTQKKIVFISSRQAIQFVIQLLINRQKCKTDLMLVLIEDLKLILNHPDKIYLNIIADLIRLAKLYRQRVKRRRPGAKIDLKRGLKSGMKDDRKEELKEDPKEDLKANLKEDKKTDIHSEDDSKEQSDFKRLTGDQNVSQSSAEHAVVSKDDRLDELKELGALLKKLEYYLSYSNENQDSLVKQVAEIEMERLYLLELKRLIDQNVESDGKDEIKIH